MFNLKTGKVDGAGDLWRTDEWIHMNHSNGMLSIFMPEKELKSFLEFLAHIPLHKYGCKKKSRNYTYESTVPDQGNVNIHISDKTLVVIGINMQFIPAFMKYLAEAE